ncbi:unnamed protein product [Closterium sp. NIES-53]
MLLCSPLSPPSPPVRSPPLRSSSLSCPALPSLSTHSPLPLACALLLLARVLPPLPPVPHPTLSPCFSSSASLPHPRISESPLSESPHTLSHSHLLPFPPAVTLPVVDVVANGKVFLHSQQGAQADGARAGSEGEGGGGGRGGRGDGDGVDTKEGRRDRGRGEGEEAGAEGGKGAERDGDGLVVEQTVEGRRLELQALPLAQTVCLYGGHLLVDPTAEEERLGSGSNNVIIAMDMMAREEGSGAGKGAEEEGEKGGVGKGERKGGSGRGGGKGGGGSEEGEELLLVFKAGGSARLTAAGMQVGWDASGGWLCVW